MLMFANTKVQSGSYLENQLIYSESVNNETEDNHEDFYILNNISFGLVNDLNYIINTFIILHYHK